MSIKAAKVLFFLGVVALLAISIMEMTTCVMDMGGI